MLDEAVMKLLDQNDPLSAFKLLVKPDDVVGIKSNVWSFLPTPPPVEKALSAASWTPASKKRTSASTITPCGRTRSS